MYQAKTIHQIKLNDGNSEVWKTFEGNIVHYLMTKFQNTSGRIRNIVNIWSDARKLESFAISHFIDCLK